MHLEDKMYRLLDILEQYEKKLPVKKEEKPKTNTFINPVIILAKRQSLKIVLDARYHNSLNDESKCNGPIEPIQLILTEINGQYFTTADMYSAYNQILLDEQSRRLTHFLIGNQQYEFNRLFSGTSIGPAAFLTFMLLIYILNKNVITYLDDVFTNKTRNVYIIRSNLILKFFLTRVNFPGHIFEGNTITSLK